MFLGHYGLAFGLKKHAPKTSLGLLVITTLFLDLLWPIFLGVGLEVVHIEPGITKVTPLNFFYYPFSHSLFAAIFWSVVVGGIYFLKTTQKKTSLVLGFGVLSHWLLDLLVHRPDLPIGISPSSHYLGLGIWNSLPWTVVFELIFFIAGLYVYIKNTTPKDKKGQYGVWVLGLLLLVTYAGAIFGPPPPSEKVIALSANAQWLYVLLSFWVDKHRS